MPDAEKPTPTGTGFPLVNGHEAMKGVEGDVPKGTPIFGFQTWASLCSILLFCLFGSQVLQATQA